LKHTKEPVRTELVEVPSPQRATHGFDRLSPNGMGVVFGVVVFPIILSLSKDRLSPNGVRGAARKESINEALIA
jgi:hypothetical protein